MSGFYVGQKVVCVNARRAPELTKGAVYSIAHVHFKDWTGAHGVTLAEIPFPDDRNGWHLPGYSERRFRPLEYKAMSIFRKIAANPKTKIREDA